MGRVSSLRTNYQTYEETYETHYASGWRKSLRWLPLLCDCDAPSCHRGNIITRFHVTHVPSQLTREHVYTRAS